MSLKYPHKSAHFTFTFSHLANAFIQSEYFSECRVAPVFMRELQYLRDPVGVFLLAGRDMGEGCGS